jgi:acyl carrier protein
MQASAQKLQTAFRQGLALPATLDVTNADNRTLRQWDSVAHLQLVVAIEDAFGVRLTPSDVIDLTSYSAAVSILQHLGAWRDA